MGPVEIHVIYLPIAGKYRIHLPDNVNECEGDCRSAWVDKTVLDFLECADDFTSKAYAIVTKLYRNGRL